MDALSDVLRFVRMSSVIHFCGEFTEPWAFTTSPAELAPVGPKMAERSVIPLHVCTEGSCWVTLGSLPPIRIEAGDTMVFPHADQHVMASDPCLPPVPIHQIYAGPSQARTGWLKCGDDGSSSRFISIYLHSNNQVDPLANSLPAFLSVCMRDSSLLLEEWGAAGRQVRPIDWHEAEWWRASLRYLISEAGTSNRPGHRATLAHLTESLFIELLRWQLRHTSHDSGWLAGLRDPNVGRAMTLLHARPDRAWTVDELAKEAATSRPALAKRFVELVGQSPIQYLIGWRIHVARHLLRETTLSVSEISGRVGYDSVASFHRAFRRLTGAPPTAWRNARETDSKIQSWRRFLQQ